MNMTAQPSGSTGDAPSKRIHIGWLDSLRALAALYVVLCHTAVTALPAMNHLRGLEMLVVGPFRYGGIAVALFIVLSGYSLMIPVTRAGGVLRGGALQFFYRRAKRILPTYYAAIVFCLVMIHFWVGHKTGTHWDSSLPVTWRGLALHLVMAQDLWSRSEIDYPMWSISVEWRIYFCFPLLVLLFRRYGSAPAAIAASVYALLAFLCLRHTPYVYAMPDYFALFALGMLACQIGLGANERLQAFRDDTRWGLVSAPFVAVWLCLLYIWRAQSTPAHIFIMDVAAGAVWFILLIALSKPGPNVLRSALSVKPLVFIGTFSYSIYLVHAPLLQIAWQYGVQPLHLSLVKGYLLTVVGGGSFIVAISYLFFLAFERPFLNMKRDRIPAKQLPDSESRGESSAATAAEGQDETSAKPELAATQP
jgi:peptidoglycan/LPS O-acetylase OafA/YrhL